MHEPAASPLTPVAELFAEVLTYLRRTFRVVVPVALLSTVTANLLAFAYGPEDILGVIAWALVVLVVSVATQSAVLWTVAQARAGVPHAAADPLLAAIGTGGPGREAQVGVARAIAAAIAFGPRYVGLSFVVGLAVFILAMSGFGLPVAAYLLVRWLVAGPALVEENRSIAEAMRRSWALVEGRWWRTAGVAVLAFIGAAIPDVAGTWLGDRMPVTALTIAFYSIGAAISLTFMSIVQVLLFEDYRRATDGTPPGQQSLTGL
jgi:hypothetical protein